MSARRSLRAQRRKGRLAARLLARPSPTARRAAANFPSRTWRWRACANTARSPSSAGPRKRCPSPSSPNTDLQLKESPAAPTTPTSANSPKLAKEWGEPFFLRFDAGDERLLVPLERGRQRQQAAAASSRPGATSTTSSPKSARPTRPGSGARTSTSPATWPRSSASTPATLRRLDLPRRLQLGQDPQLGRLESFDKVFDSTYKRVLKIAPKKPMMIGEIASEERGGSKADWIENALKTIPPQVPQDPRASSGSTKRTRGCTGRSRARKRPPRPSPAALPADLPAERVPGPPPGPIYPPPAGG